MNTRCFAVLIEADSITEKGGLVILADQNGTKVAQIARDNLLLHLPTLEWNNQTKAEFDAFCRQSRS